MKKLICSFCILLANLAAVHASVNDPIFQYRCAERAYQSGEYNIACDFYQNILSHCHNVSHLGMLASVGILDAKLSAGDWFAADAFITQNDLSIFQTLVGYDSLLLRECFLLIKNNHFRAAQNLLFSVNFLELAKEDLAWYHCLYAMILSHEKKFFDAENEFNLAENLAADFSQLATTEAVMTQCIVQNIDIDSDVDSISNSLKEKIKYYGFSKYSLPFLKQYLLLLSGLKKNDADVEKLIDSCLENLDSAENVYDVLLYQAIYLGLSSEQGVENLKTVLLKSSNKRTQLLALKLVTYSLFSSREIVQIFQLLDNVFDEATSDWLKRNILLAKMAVALQGKDFAACQDAANKYLDAFSKDKRFEEIYELLAYLALDENVNEYRLSVNYLDKLRVATEDPNTKLALTLKIADAFFYNQDFKLASEMYDEVLALDRAGKFSDFIGNQVVSDILLQNLERAKYHLSLVDFYSQKKCDATIFYIEALKSKKLYAEALDYINSIDDHNLPQTFKLRLCVYKARILFDMKQSSRAIILTTKLVESFNKKEFSNNEKVRDLISRALYIKGCCALKLSDEASALETFKYLREHFSNSRFALVSCIREAKFYTKNGDFYKARCLLEQCDITDEKYASYIQYKLAEVLYFEGKKRDALRLLESIIKKDEYSDLAILARIAQGDILRTLGSFSDAVAVYDRALSKTDQEGYIRYISLARVKCLLGQSYRKPEVLDSSITELEKLYALQTADLIWHLEVAAEYCLALKLKNNFGELQNIALDTIKNVTEEQIFSSKNACFWMVQILYLLQDSLSENEVDKCDPEFVSDLLKKYQISSQDD